MSPGAGGWEAGYVLAELLVTAVILSGGVLFLVDSMRQSLDVARRAQLTQQALVVGGDVGLRAIQEARKDGRPTAGRKVIGGTVYYWQIEEVNPVHLGGSGLQVSLCEIRVTWPESQKHGVKLPFLWCRDDQHRRVPDSR